MREVGVLEAKTHFSALLAEVENGEALAITRHGKVVAYLKPVNGAHSQPSRREIADGFRRLRDDIAARYGEADDFNIKDAIEEGRA